MCKIFNTIIDFIYNKCYECKVLDEPEATEDGYSYHVELKKIKYTFFKCIVITIKIKETTKE